MTTSNQQEKNTNGNKTNNNNKNNHKTSSELERFVLVEYKDGRSNKTTGTEHMPLTKTPTTTGSIQHTHTPYTLGQFVLGSVCFGIFTVSWVASLLSPVVLGCSLYYGNTIVTTILVVLLSLAYIPWYPDPHPVAEAFRKLCIDYTPYYFESLRLVLEGQPEPTRQNHQQPQPQEPASNHPNSKPVLLAVHPHGVFTFGWSMLVLRFRDVKFCFSNYLFWSPFFRIFARATGNPASASKPSMQQLMSSKEPPHLALLPGGFEEATITSSTAERVYLQKRFGFIKLCLQHGYNVRPVYSFGETSTYDNVQGCFATRLYLNRYGIPGVIPWGWNLVPTLPKRHVDLMVVVGPTLELPHIPHPTLKQVQTWHDHYITALTELFERNKVEAYGPETARTKKLEIW